MTTNNVTTMTKQLKRLAEMAELAAGILTDHPTAPPIAHISLGETHPAGRMRVDMQLTWTAFPGPTVSAVARWARELGTDVTLVRESAFVGINAATTATDYPVRVWDHLTHDQAHHLLTTTGTDYDENGRATITPDLALSVEWV